MKNKNRHLLYIDILGFSELVKNNPAAIKKIYAIVNSLNVHSDREYESIVSSDTMLIYNKDKPENKQHSEDLVWYLIEFAEDLHHRLIGQGIYFRAVIVTGEFQHYQLENANCFYGTGLIDAYSLEKELPSLGVFIDEKSNKLNRFFRHAKYSSKLNFLFMCRNLEYVRSTYGDNPPFIDSAFSDGAPKLLFDLRFLKDIHSAAILNPIPKIRTKYQSAWTYYHSRYPNILNVLSSNEFEVTSIAPGYEWVEEKNSLEESISFFENIDLTTQV